MPVITPTLSLISRSNTYATTAERGPMSVSIDLELTDTLSVSSAVEHQLITTSDTVAKIVDGATDVTGGTETPGTVGCYLYFHNRSSTTGDDIYVGIVSGCNDNDATATGTDSPTAPVASGTSALDEATNVTLRTMTLLPGEFAWFPWDGTGDIYYEAAAGKTPNLEFFRFNKT
tara:strand:+ start:616 stop:1137 length:522 start_codon:yes stop_codon:yes gene_type:complete